jgi:hypothetical protein
MNSPECQKCARLLKQVLAQENSRPMTILESMGGRTAEEGQSSITLQVPKVPSSLRMWTRLHPPEVNGMTVATPHLATSAHDSSSTILQRLPFNFDALKIECRPCSNVGPESGARAFVMGPTPLSIVLCSNRLALDSTEEMEQVLVHELLHVYDVRVNRLDLRDCENLAYSEVRAAREAECANAWLAGRYCVPQRAYRAVSNLFPPHQAKACLANVFDQAMKDTAPLTKQTKPCTATSASTSQTPPKRRMTFHFGSAAGPSER